MKKLLPFFLIPFAFIACKKCVECEIRLKQSQDVIGYVDEFCGSNKKVEDEEERLLAEYYCIECSALTGMGTVSSGIHCGNRFFVDSVEADWESGALASGTSANCIYYRDTANVRCVLKN